MKMKRKEKRLSEKCYKKAICKACLSRDFFVYRATDRPHFKCNNCGHTWTKGKSGGEYYTEYLKNHLKRKDTM